MKLSLGSVILALAAFAVDSVSANSHIKHGHHDHARMVKRANPLATVYTKCVKNNTVAITFDDGPYSYIYDISRTLIQYGAKGTFFFNGNNYGCIYSADNQKRVKYAYNNGHQVASHTWAHRNLSTLTWDQIHDEMYRTELALQRIVGVNPAMMRPPYGEYNDLVRQASYIRNQSLIIWDFDSGDSVGVSATDSKKRYDDIVKKHPANILTLNHEPYSTTAFDVLPHALSVLKAKGYKMVTVAECLGKPAYQWTKTAPPADPSWKC